jgi:hypothetical protein
MYYRPEGEQVEDPGEAEEDHQFCTGPERGRYNRRYMLEFRFIFLPEKKKIRIDK